MTKLLEHTKKKVDGVLKNIIILKSLDFPYNDSLNVIKIIEETFLRARQDLEDASSIENEESTKVLCQRMLERITSYLPILGFLGRSADLEGPIELQGPILRLTHKVVGVDAKLIIFSEWKYSPFTNLFPELNKNGIILVGLPCIEGNNALIAPTAGHELGHNIWAIQDYEEQIIRDLQKLIIDKMRAEWDNVFKELTGLDGPDLLEGMLGGIHIEIPSMWALRQSEEMFCDFIGLLIFREAYLHSFEYLVAPGSSDRYTCEYPSLKDRARYLTIAANKFGIPVPANYSELFTEDQVDSTDNRAPYFMLADFACESVIEKLIDIVLEFGRTHDLESFNKNDTLEIVEKFRHVVPANDPKTISNIVNAAWIIANEPENFLTKEYPESDPENKNAVLNELVLKTIEILEINERIGGR